MMRVSLFLVLQAACLVLAPFPETHPYSFLNPVIDPWWHRLDKQTQMNVYALWETHEPSLLAFAKTVSLLQRHLLVSRDVLRAFASYLGSQTVDLKDRILQRNQPEGSGRFKSDSQEKWENFSALVQYANWVKMNAKMSAIELLDTHISSKVNMLRKAARAKINTVQGVFS